MSKFQIGDRCIVNGVRPNHVGYCMNGEIVHIVGGPMVRSDLGNHIAWQLDKHPPNMPWCIWCIEPCLIKLPPDEDMKRMLAEDKKGRPVKTFAFSETSWLDYALAIKKLSDSLP